MSEQLNPNIFIFQELVIQILEFIKKNNKKTKLDEIDILSMVNQQKYLNLEKFNEYLFIGLSSPKTKDAVINFYEKIFKQNLYEKRNLPENLLARLIKEYQNQSSVPLAKCLSTIITNRNIFIMNIEKSKSLKYLLECSRNKINGSFFSGILQDIFNYLAPYSQPEIDVFLSYYINFMINEVQLHNAQDIEYNLELHTHQTLENKGKYGRCFMCNKLAGNFDKQIRVPLCGFQCKTNLTEMRLRIQNIETFDLFNWLIDQSIYGDEIIFRQIQKEMKVAKKRVTQTQLRILIPQLLKNAKITEKNISLICHKIFVEIFSSHQIYLKNQLKVYLKEMIKQLQSSPNIQNRLSILKLFSQFYKTAQNIHSIYVNYDCKYYETNLLEEQISTISKLSLSDEDENIRSQARRCFVELLNSQIDFIKKNQIIIKNKEQQNEDEEIARERKVKLYTQKAILLFNKKPTTGIQYLKSNYFENQEMSIPDIARFIKQNTETQTKINTKKIKLKKSKIGEYFGQPIDFNIEVYKAYLKLIHFQGLTIDNALRQLLSHFALPKEAQQIGRVLQHFSNQYFPFSGLANSDGCYLLIYAILMLQTSLYNPEIKQNQRMKVEGFLSICKGIEGMDNNKLEQIYYSIATTPLSIKPQFSESYMLSKGYLNPYSQYQLSSSNQLVSILQYIWQYVYVSLVDRNSIEGLYQAVVVYGSCNLEEASSFIAALVKQAQKGNILAYDMILKLAALQGKSLGKSWNLIIKFIFQMEESDISQQSQFDISIIDKIFQSSATLTDDKFLEFLYEFCKFSSSDFKDNKYNRQMFVLRHIIEIVSYNLHRVQIIWHQLWEILNDYFMGICLHPRQDVSMSAIDSLKQLNLKLLKIPEIGDFQQKQYMTPLLQVFERGNMNTKQLIVNIVGMIACKELKSGWEVLFQILQKSENEAVLKVVNRIIEVGLHYVVDHQKLHKILIKELNLANDDQIHQTLELLQIITKYKQTQEIWLLTLKTIRGKYQNNLNTKLSKSFFEIVSSIKFRHSPQIFEEIYKMNNFVSRSRDFSNSSLIFSAINDIEITILLQNFEKTVEMWDINLQSQNKRIFLPFFHSQVTRFINHLSEKQIEIVVYMLLKKHNQTLPIQILKLRELDEDFKKKLDQLPDKLISTNNKSDLIELTLQKQRYEFNSMLHIIIIRLLHNIFEVAKQNEHLASKITTAIKQSYKLSVEFNQCVVLRKFLWQNKFMKTQNGLPGLLKQQIFSLKFLIDTCNTVDLENYAEEQLKKYIQRHLLLKKVEILQQNLYKNLYKDEIEGYILNFKQILIQIFKAMQKQSSKWKNAQILYESILSVNQTTTYKQIIQNSKSLLKLLLRQILLNRPVEYSN